MVIVGAMISNLVAFVFVSDGVLIDLSERNNLDGPGGVVPQPPGFIGYPPGPGMPPLPQAPAHRPFEYPVSELSRFHCGTSDEWTNDAAID